MTRIAGPMEALSPEKQALLSKLKQRPSTANGAQMPGVTVQPVARDRTYYPLSYGQERLWILSEFSDEAARAYNLVFQLHLVGPLNTAALHKSLNYIVARHEAFRTCFAIKDEAPVQLVEPAVDMALPHENYVDQSAEDRQKIVHEFVHLAALETIDLQQAPLFRATLLQFGETHHVLIMGIHHIIFDAWSQGIFLQELAAGYNAFCQEHEPDLPPLPVQYIDYAHWQRNRLDGPAGSEQLAYWQKQLAGVPNSLNLLTDYARPAVQTFNGADYTFHISPELARQIRQQSQEMGVTSFMTLLAAFQILLSRYTRQTDFCIGTPIAGRTRPEFEKLIGFFLNTLVLRADLSDDPTVRELLRRVRQTTLTAYQHQDLPFEQLVKTLHSERNLSHSPFFQALFNYVNVPQPEWTFAQLQVEEMTVSSPAAKFDLNLAINDEGDGGLTAVLTYNTDLFSAPTIARLAGHYRVLLAEMVVAPDTAVSGLPLLTEAEKQQIVTWADTSQLQKPFVPLHTLFAQQAAQIPDTPAVICDQKQLSYSELNARANQVAHHLQQLGVGPESCVGLLMHRSLDIMVALLGILKAGAAYVPVDPIYPAGRVQAMMADIDVTVVLTEHDLASMIAGIEVPVICLDSEWAVFSQHSTDNPDVVLAPENLMYVLFTSGSTGRPKGVAVAHRNYLNYFHGIVDETQIQPGMQFAMVTTFGTDLGTIMFWGALCFGGTVHIFSYDKATDPKALAAYFRRQPMDVLKLVPSHLQSLLAGAEMAELAPRHLVIFTGEPSYWELVKQVQAANPACLVQDHYGVTETTCATTVFTAPTDADHTVPALPKGYPLPNVRIHILDKNMQPTPISVPGELYIGGDGVTRGYFRRPQLTAQRFVPDPFSERQGGRLYKTGDLACYRADGTIKLLGRMDFQLKVRGYRIELGEIETLLKQETAVHDSVVTAHEDESGNRQLIAYVVPGADSFDVHTIRTALQNQLPNYMIPAAIIPLDKIPLNPNGKVDRFALPDPESHTIRQDAYIPPRNELEATIASVWADVLEVEKVGVDHNFFDLGGDSFKAVRAVRRIDRQLSVLTLFKYPTVATLAAHLSEGASAKDTYLHRLTPPGLARQQTSSLICFPYGGGDAVVFQGMANALPPGNALFAVQLPGHDFARPHESLQSLSEITSRVSAEILQQIEGPLILYGHCVGSASAVETARLLEEAGREVQAVYIGGSFPSPRLPGRLFDFFHRLFPGKHWQSRRSLYENLRNLGGFADVDDEEEVMFALRNLQHDAYQAEDFFTKAEATPPKPLKAPIICVIGQMDRATEFYQERVHEWRLFAQDVALVVIEQAGHYFLKHQAKEVTTIIADNTKSQSETGRPAAIKPLPNKAAATPKLSTFFVVALGQIISLIGTGLTSFALGAWVYQQTGAVSSFALITAFALLPGILIGPLAGFCADRFDRRRLMIVADFTAAISTLVVAILFLSNQLQVWHLYFTISAASIANAFHRPAYLAAVAQLVPKQYLGRANGLVQGGIALGNLTAPLLGGVMLLAWGLHGVILVDFATFLVAITALLLVRLPQTLFHHREEGFVQEVSGGWRYMMHRPSLGMMIGFFMIANFFLGLLTVIITPLILSFGSTATLGTAMGLFGAGMLAGSILMGVWGGSRRRMDGILWFTLLLGCGIMLIGLRPAIALVGTALFLVGISISVANAHWLALIQTKVGLELQGRVLALIEMLETAMLPLAFFLAGPLADKLFEPLLAVNGALAGSLGRIIGVGPGRGMALLLILIGGSILALGIGGFYTRRLRYLEDSLPDAIPDAIIVADKDQLQQMSDAQLLNMCSE